MTFNEFVDYTKEHIQEYLPDRYQNAEITVDTVQKTNEKYTGLYIKPEGVDSAPIVNMDNLFKDYLRSDDLMGTLQYMSEMLQTAIPPEINPDLLQEYSQVKDMLFVRVSQLEGSEEIAAGSPHRVTDDLLMTYHIYIPGNDGIMSARITNDLMTTLGVDAKQLHEDAISNTSKIMPARVQSMMEALTGIEEEDPQMIVISNEIGMFGAGALFCNGVMDQVSEKLHGDYFLLPSSIHEWIAVPDNGNYEISDLENMVRSANLTVVDEADRLSDRVFHYDVKERLFERTDRFEDRKIREASERRVGKQSLIGRLNSKKEQIAVDNHKGKEMQRQPGMAI